MTLFNLSAAVVANTLNLCVDMGVGPAKITILKKNFENL